MINKVNWTWLRGRIRLRYDEQYGDTERRGWTLFVNDGVAIMLRPWWKALLLLPRAFAQGVFPRTYSRLVVWKFKRMLRKGTV